MKALAVDLGEKNVGLALSDPAGKVAMPFDTLERKNDRSLIRRILQIVSTERVERLVVGEPIGLNGQRGQAAHAARAFAQKLTQATGLPVVLVNESLTSREAERRLREAGIDPRKHPLKVDAVAAQIVLQEALDNS
jgi:putative Holliday junction resolvase